MRKFALLFAATAAVVVSAASTARADWPWDFAYYGGYNWGFQRYALTNNQMPPYFAMFPPVYYRARFRLAPTAPVRFPIRRHHLAKWLSSRK